MTSYQAFCLCTINRGKRIMRKHEKSQYFCLQCIAVIFGRQKKQSSALSPLTLWWKNMIRPMLSASMTTLVKYSVAQPTVHNLLKRFDKLSGGKKWKGTWQCAGEKKFQEKGLQIKRNWSKPSHLDHCKMFCTVEGVSKRSRLGWISK